MNSRLNSKLIYAAALFALAAPALHAQTAATPPPPAAAPAPPASPVAAPLTLRYKFAVG